MQQREKSIDSQDGMKESLIAPGERSDVLSDEGNHRIDGWSFYAGGQTSEFTYSDQICWGTIQTVIMAVISETFVEFTCPEKSPAAAFTLAVVAPLSIEWIKFAFNLSGALKRDFDFDTLNYRKNFVQIVMLLLAALIVYEAKADKGFSSIGYNSVIIASGIVLKHLINYFMVPVNTAAIDDSTASLLDTSDQAIVLEAEQPINTHKNQWYNGIAMHGLARMPLLFCATNAGGQFFEAMKIPLAEGIEACGLTNFGAIVAFSVLFNEIIGSHLFVGSQKFENAHANLVSRTMTMFALAIGLQAANILKEVTLGNFTAAFAIGFFADLLVQESGLGNKIDRAVEHGLSTFQAKCCQWQPAKINDVGNNGAVYTPLNPDTSNRSV